MFVELLLILMFAIMFGCLIYFLGYQKGKEVGSAKEAAHWKKREEWKKTEGVKFE